MKCNSVKSLKLLHVAFYICVQHSSTWISNGYCYSNMVTFKLPLEPPALLYIVMQHSPLPSSMATNHGVSLQHEIGNVNIPLGSLSWVTHAGRVSLRGQGQQYRFTSHYRKHIVNNKHTVEEWCSLIFKHPIYFP